MAQISHLPNLRTGVTASREKYDPMHSSIFEVIFELPSKLSVNGDDIAILSEQVTTVGGLDALQKTTAAGEQKFLGTSQDRLLTLATVDNNPTDHNNYSCNSNYYTSLHTPCNNGQNILSVMQRRYLHSMS